ncbi:MAG TPA: alpha/beta hydrolase [Acidimicrobiales bacterium]|nr:alpha/beta hydrolase [Acidimicrobiales bacterium]
MRGLTYRFDPELVPFAEMLPALTLEDIGAARAGLAGMAGAAPPVDESGVEHADRHVPRSDVEGGPVPVRVYRPRGSVGDTAAAVDARRPAVLYIHGGGFVLGSVELEHAGAVRLAENIGAVVVSVEYRLAPEHPYPAGIDDCFLALQWLHAEADALGVDRDRVAVAGSSAGGGLAAGVALMARDRGGPPLCFQYLGIPELDDRLATPSMRAFIDTPVWSRPNAVLSWRYYLGPALAGSGPEERCGDVPIYAAPARATDLSGLPPAYVSTMEYDPLRDEGIDYAVRLMQAGVSTELHCFPGTWHGSTMIVTAQVSLRSGREMYAVLGKALGAPAPEPTPAPEPAAA